MRKGRCRIPAPTPSTSPGARLRQSRSGSRMPHMAMERIELTRDCDAVQIPIGTSVLLEKGTEVYLMQSLGGSYTVQAPSYGGLFRIAGRDADAIGDAE